MHAHSPKPQSQPEIQLPKLEVCPVTNEQRFEGFFELLDQEILTRVKSIEELRDSVHKERQGLIGLIEQCVKDTFSQKFGNGYVGIKIFGSIATDLAIETSDVDLVVTGVKIHEDRNKRNQVIKILQKLTDTLTPLKEEGQLHKINFIATANLPIIKLVADLEVINQIQMEKAIDRAKKNHAKSNPGKEESIVALDFQQLGIDAKNIDPKMRFLKVDISVDEVGGQELYFEQNMGPTPSKGHSGIDTIYHIKELCRQRKDLRPIVMIIKKIFDETYLSMPYYGGISSFALVLMVSAYLKKYDGEHGQPLSMNLFSFFHFYSTGFIATQHYLDGDNIMYAEGSEERPFKDAALIVVDPLDRSNNISQSSYRFRDIQRAFVSAFKLINDALMQYQEDASSG